MALMTGDFLAKGCVIGGVRVLNERLDYVP